MIKYINYFCYLWIFASCSSGFHKKGVLTEENEKQRQNKSILSYKYETNRKETNYIYIKNVLESFILNSDIDNDLNFTQHFTNEKHKIYLIWKNNQIIKAILEKNLPPGFQDIRKIQFKIDPKLSHDDIKKSEFNRNLFNIISNKSMSILPKSIRRSSYQKCLYIGKVGLKGGCITHKIDMPRHHEVNIKSDSYLNAHGRLDAFGELKAHGVLNINLGLVSFDINLKDHGTFVPLANALISFGLSLEYATYFLGTIILLISFKKELLIALSILSQFILFALPTLLQVGSIIYPLFMPFYYAYDIVNFDIDRITTKFVALFLITLFFNVLQSYDLMMIHLYKYVIINHVAFLWRAFLLGFFSFWFGACYRNIKEDIKLDNMYKRLKR